MTSTAETTPAVKPKYEGCYHVRSYTEEGRVLSTFGDSLPELGEGAKILDWGCSIGITTKELAGLYPCAAVEGIDIGKSLIDYGKRQERDYSLLHGDGFQHYLSGKIYDAVFCMNNIFFGIEGKEPDMIERDVKPIALLVAEMGYLLISGSDSDKRYRNPTSPYIIFRREPSGFETMSKRYAYEPSMIRLNTIENVVLGL